jgi:ribonuclease HI
MEAVKWAKNNCFSISIFYDYTGVEKFAVGAWRPQKPITKAYRSYMKGRLSDVTFVKVKGHSGNKWNDYVDELIWREKGISQGK